MDKATDEMTVKLSTEQPYSKHIYDVGTVQKLEGHSKFLMSRLRSHDKISQQHRIKHLNMGMFLHCYADDLVAVYAAAVTSQ